MTVTAVLGQQAEEVQVCQTAVRLGCQENHQEKLGRDVSFFARLGEECPFP
jgi:hypothetical protein